MDTPVVPRSFNIFLADLADGRVLDELTIGLKDVINAMQDAAASGGGRASGGITLSIGFKLDRGAYIPTAEVKVKKPKVAFPLSVFWPTEDGLLSRQDPRQQNLELRDVNAPEVRTVLATRA